MKPGLLFPSLVLACGLHAAEPPDLLRFTNGDQLHGKFHGLTKGPQAMWQRDDLEKPAGFATDLIRHIVLNSGRPRKSLESFSYAGLVCGDRIPGTVTGIDTDHIMLETSYAGTLKIPRGEVAMLAPNPMGGRVYYHGPFCEEDWKMIHPSLPMEKPKPAEEDVTKEEPTPAKPDEDKPATDDSVAPKWQFSGSAWYWQDKRAGTALVREQGMPDRAVLAFDMAWKNRLGLAVAFHADFAQAKPKEEDAENKQGNNKGQFKGQEFVPGDIAELARIFGNSYILQMFSNYLMLYRSSINEDGVYALERVQLINNNFRLGDTGQARVEIRSNRSTGGISLFVNDEFISQWSEGDFGGRDSNFAGKGPGYGFVVQTGEAPMRISDVMVAEWNGMPDSARSLEVDDQDVVLMANGTDRYAGRVGTFEQGNVLFEGRHGKFRFPITEVAEIRFARNSLAKPAEPAGDRLQVRFSPMGSLAGQPLGGDQSSLSLLHPVLGELNLTLDHVVMLEFNPSSRLINDWDAEF